MKNKNIWIDISIFNLCIVAALGIILRSKILFALPGINYINFLDTHSHFAFSGWLTLALLFLLVGELMPQSRAKKKVYKWLLGGITLSAWGILVTMPLDNKSLLSNFFSDLFIIITYLFGWIFIKDILKADLNKTVTLLSISALAALILSSIGPITLVYLHTLKINHAFLYRDALYVFLHLQYNGFFTLSVFALFFHKLYPKIPIENQQKYFRFSILLCSSVLPSLFLSFLWEDPGNLFRLIALLGSILIFLSVTWYIVIALPLLKYTKAVSPVIRYTFFLSMGAFVLKMFLQSFTIFSSVGNAVYGDRPAIIGYLHLVFLGFVSVFILAYYVQNEVINMNVKLTRYALLIFVTGVILNEIILMMQGVGAIFLLSSFIFSWLLWGVSICLLIGVLLVMIARIKSRNLVAGSK